MKKHTLKRRKFLELGPLIVAGPLITNECLAGVGAGLRAPASAATRLNETRARSTRTQGYGLMAGVDLRAFYGRK
jgi:hypothetical protein